MAVWGNTAVILPDEAPTAWQNALTGERLVASSVTGVRGLDAGQVFASLPVAILLGES